MKQFSNKVIKKTLTFCSVFLLFYLLSFICDASVKAQESLRQSALGVSPAILELVLTPGKKTEAKVNVINITNFPLPIKGTIKSFVAGETLVDLNSIDKEVFNASSWIKIDPADFILQPRENKEIKVTILASKKAGPGGHYATIYFQPLIPQEALSPQTTYLTARVGILAFLIVRGDIKEEASLGNLEILSTTSLSGGKIKLKQFGPVDFQIPFENNGNVHLVPTGEVVISDFRGRVVTKLSVPPATVLPKSSHIFSLQWPKKYLLGKYFAKAIFLYGTEHVKLESETLEIWVVPWVPILCLIVLLTTLILFLTIVRRRITLALKVLFGKVEVRGEDLLTYKEARFFKRRKWIKDELSKTHKE